MDGNLVLLAVFLSLLISTINMQYDNDDHQDFPTDIGHNSLYI